MTCSKENIRDRWFLDTCASEHIVNNIKYFQSFGKNDKTESIGTSSENSKIPVLGYGTVKVFQVINGEKIEHKLINVAYAPTNRTNLISGPKAQMSGMSLIFIRGTKLVGKLKRKTVLMGSNANFSISELM